ncbi:surfactin synthase thioesterase subunit [Saccharothrix carnea]|uniref:Surfactin synthase thioesterase subunit n=1 Tax=Saccharothrix carnea TaxID=1280637 RepID=A0A2P8I0I9_SACCR|nr:alpha/beta fold hydrolase [Saccharothrix carnea]PSL51989.1 surfactin synthase thioesterase subunit [Saccharothrix carnea]
MRESQERTGQAREPGRQTHLASRPDHRKWVQHPRPNPEAGLSLVCLPYSGGRASVYKGLAALLPDDVEVCAVELPGHGRRFAEAPMTSLRPLVEQLADVVAEQVRRPYVLLGYSVGALIGFETARELARRGRPGPRALFVAAARAPHLRSPRRPLHELSRAELVGGLHELAGQHNAMLDNEELVDVMLPVLRADLGLDETYVREPGPPLDCPIAAFGGSEDRTVPRPDLEAWREHTTGGFSVTTLPGGHFFLDAAPELFAEALTDAMKRLERGVP